MKKYLLPIFFIITFATPAYAQNEFEPLNKELSKYYKELIVPIGVVLAAVMIIYAGILYATSQGDPAKTTLAKEFLFGAIIGLVLLLAAGWIVSAIVSY